MTSEDNFNLFAEIIAKPKGLTKVPFPIKHPKTDKEFEVPMVLLSAEEAAICEANAVKKAAILFKDGLPKKDSAEYPEYVKVLDKFGSAEVLHRAVRNVSDIKRPFFPRPEDVLQLNVDHIAVLINHYNDIQTNLQGIMNDGMMTDETIRAWSAKLVESGTKSSFLLNSWQLGTLKILIMYMADQLRNLQNQNSSSGTNVETMLPTE